MFTWWMGWPPTCYCTYLGPPPPCKQALRLCLHYILDTILCQLEKLSGMIWTATAQNWNFGALNTIFTSVSVCFQLSLLLLIYFRYGVNTCSHCDEEGQKCIRYKNYHDPLSRLAWCSVVLLQKSNRNHPLLCVNMWFFMSAPRPIRYSVNIAWMNKGILFS